MNDRLFVDEGIINDTIAGALRTISAYMDWMPLTVGGDLTKGNVLTMGLDSTKNTDISIDLTTTGEYSFHAQKNGPYSSPPVELMKKVAIASFLVRGNLYGKETTTGNGWRTETTKWFPELSDNDWQVLAERMLLDFKEKLEKDFNLEVLQMSDVTSSDAYTHAKTIEARSSKNFVEVGAQGTKRILTSTMADFYEDMSITFPGDYISERLVKELGVDAVIAVSVDLNFNFQSEGLDPVITIEAFAPNVSYKTAATYFTMRASTDTKSLADNAVSSGTVAEALYRMIKAEEFAKGFVLSLKELSEKEDAYPVYEGLWRAKL